MIAVVCAHNVVGYSNGGGHFWVYLQYAHGLRKIGWDVWWLEELRPSGDPLRDAFRIETLASRLERYGLGGRLIVFTSDGRFLNVSQGVAKDVFRRADFLLNFQQTIAPWVLERFSCTAMVDIDPGLLQYWMSAGVLSVPKHDVYFTTGETVGNAGAPFPDCGLEWHRIRPPVNLDLWPCRPAPGKGAFTTVSGWWGDDEWVEFAGEIYDNNKRASFLQFIELPKLTATPLELALMLDPNSAHDERDRELLLRSGWGVRHSHDVAGTPEDYQEYIAQSRGEFSCAKASCMKFQNAWVSDRTLCYLASGRPVVVQDTGPSALLPNGLGMFRFSTVAEAAAALDAVQGNYAKHSAAARELAREFDAKRVCETIVQCAGGSLVGAER